MRVFRGTFASNSKRRGGEENFCAGRVVAIGGLCASEITPLQLWGSKVDHSGGRGGGGAV